MEKQELPEGEKQEHIQSNEAKECRMCKYVLLISFGLLFVVMVLVFQEGTTRMQNSATGSTTAELHALPITVEQAASNSQVYSGRVLELGQVLSDAEHERNHPSAEITQ